MTGASPYLLAPSLYNYSMSMLLLICKKNKNNLYRLFSTMYNRSDASLVLFVMGTYLATCSTEHFLL